MGFQSAISGVASSIENTVTSEAKLKEQKNSQMRLQNKMFGMNQQISSLESELHKSQMAILRSRLRQKNLKIKNLELQKKLGTVEV